MSEAMSNYYELNKIKPYRLIAIDQAVKRFKKAFGIKHLPIDCVQLAIEINKKDSYNIKIRSTEDLPKRVLGRTHYIRQADLYLISINSTQLHDSMKNRSKYPYMYSSDRMVNFTLAHEFGHIFLEHAEIPDEDKDDALKEEEDLEANEFAGRLLMPKHSIENCNFSNVSEVAAQYLVSEQAILKRLTHLKRHDKRRNKPIEVCSNCWNPNIKSDYQFCPVCGVPLTDKKGVLTMHYTDGYKMDDGGRAIPCPQCANTKYEDRDTYCRICGLYLLNVCTSDFCEAMLDDGSARYCFYCGSQSSFLASGILSDWKPVKQALLSIHEVEEDICGVGNCPQPIEQWGYMIGELSKYPGTYLSQLLEGSDGMFYNGKLIVYVKAKDTKEELELAKYHEGILAFTQGYLELDIEAVHIIAFEEHLPTPEPVNYDDVPF